MSYGFSSYLITGNINSRIIIEPINMLVKITINNLTNETGIQLSPAPNHGNVWSM